MSAIIRANIELIPEQDCASIAAIDAQVVSSTPSEYVKENQLGYYILINSWLMIVKQVSQYGWIYLWDHIRTNGLFSAIRLFDGAASQLIAGEDIPAGIALSIFNDIVNSWSHINAPSDMSKTIMSSPVSYFLTVARYPKRFSPFRADILGSNAIDAFISRQRQYKYDMRSEIPMWLAYHIRESIKGLIDWDSLMCELGRLNISDLIFTPGVSFDTKADLMSKLKRVLEERAEYFPQPFGIPCVASGNGAAPEFWGARGDLLIRDVKLLTVPKNYKTARVIAPEDVTRQAFARAVFNTVDRYLPKEFVDLHDQSVNQEWARLGSIDGSLATIDLSNASDAVTKAHLSLFPTSFAEYIEPLLPTHYVINGRRYPLYSAATMGNSMTFAIETILFMGVSKAAIDYVRLYDDSVPLFLGVFGDDIVVPTQAAATVIEWLERLNFTVNREKSFYDSNSRYRESCGEEYIGGHSVSSYYYPRFPIGGNTKKMRKFTLRDTFRNVTSDTLSSIVALQQKLFLFCVPAAMLLREIVLEIEPRMTSSTPDSPHSDLYGYEETVKPMALPIFEVTRTVTPSSHKWVSIKPVITTKWKRTYSDIAIRDAHLTPSTIISRRKGSKDQDTEDERMLLDLYNYLQFLKHGPRYESELDRLLRVSAPPLSMGQAKGYEEVSWTYTF